MHLAYFQHQRIGDLMARMTNDLTWVRQMMGPGIMQGSFTVMVFTFSVLSMISVSLKLTVIALILMPLASLTFWYIGRTVHQRFERLQSQFGDMSTKAQENFSGIRVVKAFSQEDAETKDFAAVNYEYFRRAVALSAMQGLIWPSISFILGIAVLSVLYVGGQDAIRGELSIGSLVQFVAYLYLLQMPMINIGWISNMFQAGWASLGRLQEIFNAVPKITDPIDPVTAPIQGEVEFRGVSFAYGQTIELHDVSFKVPAGGSLAIVGPTGSGKSTMVNLIPRLFDAQQGEVLIDDALSAVDTYTEAEILRRLRGVMRERTSIVVAHRISTVKDADEILVLDGGRIVERGSHRDLLEHGGLYAQMYRRQLLEEELEVDEEREEHSKRVKAEADEGPQLGMRPRLGGIGGEP